MEGRGIIRSIVLVIACIVSIAPGATALENDFTFVDFLAFVIGFLIAFVGFCACLGAYARRQNVGLVRVDMVTILDGGLATTLQEAGYDVEGHPLWSAHLLRTKPQAIVAAHAKFIEAGADIITTASYQASVQNLQQHLKLSAGEAVSLMKDSVTLAKQAADASGRDVRLAGSVGPYGACLGDGSEYTGNYLASMDRAALKEWHRPRVAALVAAGADLLAVETLPGPAEALAVLELLREYPGMPAWVSFSCQDGSRTCDGSLFADAAAAVCAASDVTLAVGVNCSAPEDAVRLLAGLDRRRVPLPLVVYPNSGELWRQGRFTGERLTSLLSYGRRYMTSGATYIGGCCRVGPDQIRELRAGLRSTPSDGSGSAARKVV